MKAWALACGERAESLERHAAGALRDAGVEVESVRGGATGPGVIFFDAVSPELCDLVQTTSHDGGERVIAIGSEPEALGGGASWRVIGAGASDVIAWGDTRRCAEHVAARLERWHHVDELPLCAVARHGLVGDSPPWRSVLRQVIEVARFTDAPVLITGESGTGKELVARLIHVLDPRPYKSELVVVDCTTIVPTLSGSEFFGHERGSFTGAVSTRDGAFALADGGTLFLDEVGELPLPLQAELLRVVQEGTYKRVGSNTWRETAFRLVCATNRDLLEEAAEGRFRRDLYYRIAGWSFRLPALRGRSQDILLFISHFLSELQPDGASPELDDVVREFLLAREYPGNVRDLRHLVSRLSYRHVGPGPLTLGDIPEEERAPQCTGDAWRADELDEPVRRALARGVSAEHEALGARRQTEQPHLGELDPGVQPRPVGAEQHLVRVPRRAGRTGAEPGLAGANPCTRVAQDLGVAGPRARHLGALRGRDVADRVVEPRDRDAAAALVQRGHDGAERLERVGDRAGRTCPSAGRSRARAPRARGRGRRASRT
jgi:transcriptional regulator with AAA-type ATPase domain